MGVFLKNSNDGKMNRILTITGESQNISESTVYWFDDSP